MRAHDCQGLVESLKITKGLLISTTKSYWQLNMLKRVLLLDDAAVSLGQGIGGIMQGIGVYRQQIKKKGRCT